MVDDHLHYQLKNLSSYVKDTFHLLNILDKCCISTDTILVKTLYSSILRQLGLKVLAGYVDMWPFLCKPLPGYMEAGLSFPHGLLMCSVERT